MTKKTAIQIQARGTGWTSKRFNSVEDMNAWAARNRRTVRQIRFFGDAPGPWGKAQRNPAWITL